jgi:hypothetical protein
MNKLFTFLIAVFLISFSYAQDRQCGQLPVIKPTEKAVCNNDVSLILNENLPEVFKKNETYHSSFKIILDCNGLIEFVVYKKGNLNTEQQKYFLTQINKLKDWKVAKQNGNYVSSVLFITIDVKKRKAEYKFYQ